MNFDPIDYMNSADANNVQLMNSVDEAQFKNFTDMVLQDIKHGPRNQQNMSKNNSILQNLRATKFLQTEQSNEKISPRANNKPLLQTASLNKRKSFKPAALNTNRGGARYFDKQPLSPSNKVNFRDSMNVSEEPHRLSSTTTNGMKGFRNLLGQNFVE